MFGAMAPAAQLYAVRRIWYMGVIPVPPATMARQSAQFLSRHCIARKNIPQHAVRTGCRTQRTRSRAFIPFRAACLYRSLTTAGSSQSAVWYRGTHSRGLHQRLPCAMKRSHRGLSFFSFPAKKAQKSATPRCAARTAAWSLAHESPCSRRARDCGSVPRSNHPGTAWASVGRPIQLIAKICYFR